MPKKWGNLFWDAVTCCGRTNSRRYDEIATASGDEGMLPAEAAASLRRNDDKYGDTDGVTATAEEASLPQGSAPCLLGRSVTFDFSRRVMYLQNVAVPLFELQQALAFFRDRYNAHKIFQFKNADHDVRAVLIMKVNTLVFYVGPYTYEFEELSDGSGWDTRSCRKGSSTSLCTRRKGVSDPFLRSDADHVHAVDFDCLVAEASRVT